MLQHPGAEHKEAAAARRRARYDDPGGIRRLAKKQPVITASDLILEGTERRLMK